MQQWHRTKIFSVLNAMKGHAFMNGLLKGEAPGLRHSWNVQCLVSVSSGKNGLNIQWHYTCIVRRCWSFLLHFWHQPLFISHSVKFKPKKKKTPLQPLLVEISWLDGSPDLLVIIEHLSHFLCSRIQIHANADEFLEFPAVKLQPEKWFCVRFSRRQKHQLHVPGHVPLLSSSCCQLLIMEVKQQH